MLSSFILWLFISLIITIIYIGTGKRKTTRIYITLLVLLSGVISCTIIDNAGPSFFISYSILLGIIMVISFVLNKIDQAAIKEREEKTKKKQAYMKNHRIPSDAYIVGSYIGYTEPNTIPCYLWIENNIMKLIPTENYAYKGNLIRISISSINYFTQKGDFYTTTNISGGGGGGSSIKGAIAGGILAGSTGAIIGSRKKADPIKSETRIIDNRKTIIEYRTLEKSKNYLYLNSNAYNVLMREIPEKEKSLA